MTAALSAGVGGALLVEGEQGIGKTELLRVSLGVASGCRLLWGAADELGQPVPLTLMRQCLAGVDIGRPGGSPDAGRAGWVFAGDSVLADLEGILAAVDRLCAESPVVLVAEDLQWADEASVLAWYQLSRAVRQLPLLVAGSVRPGNGREDVARLRRSLTVRGGTVIDLGPLPHPEMDLLVGNLVGGRPGEQLSHLMGWAGGNPLYARELADGLTRDGRIQVEAGAAELIGGPGLARVPESVSAAIAGRLEHLAEDVVTVLRRAAVLGQEFSVSDLEVLTGRPAGELMGIIGSAQAAGVVADAGRRMAFRHGLIRQVLFDQIPAVFRADLHRQAAQALAAAGVASERVAAQLIAVAAVGTEQAGAAEPGPAGDWAAPSPAEALQPWLLEWLPRVLPVLLYRAPQVTADLLRSVLAQLAGDDPRRGQFEATVLNALFLLGRDADVEAAGRRLLAETRDPDRAGEIGWLVAYSMVRAGRAIEASVVLGEVQARPGTGAGMAARLSVLHGHILAVLGRIDQAAEAARAALASTAADPVAPGYAHYVLSSVAYLRRDTHARLDHVNQGLAALGNDTQLTDLRLLLLANYTNVLADLDSSDEALASGREAVVLAERGGAPRVFWARTMLAVNYFTCGLWDDALTEVEPAVDREYSGYIGHYAHALAALIAGHRGDPSDAAEHLSVVPDTTGWVKQAGPQSLHGPLWARAVAAEQRGDPGEAIAVLAQCLEPTLGEMMPTRHVLLPDLTRLALAVGDTGLAQAAADAASREAQREPLAWKQAAADHCRGLVQGDAQAVLAAADYARAADRPLDYGQALENAAVMAAASGDVALARDRAANAVRQYAKLGARWDIRRAAARLQAYGIRRVQHSYRERPATGWEALTATEVKVAHLVARGLSNPDIAAELFLSRNTVQTHVSHILAKLGAHSRAEIIRLAAAHPSPAAAR